MFKKIISVGLTLCLMLSITCVSFADVPKTVAEKQQEFNQVVKVKIGSNSFDKDLYAKSLMGLSYEEEFPLVKTSIGTSYFDVDEYLQSVTGNSSLTRATSYK